LIKNWVYKKKKSETNSGGELEEDPVSEKKRYKKRGEFTMSLQDSRSAMRANRGGIIPRDWGKLLT